MSWIRYYGAKPPTSLTLDDFGYPIKDLLVYLLPKTFKLFWYPLFWLWGYKKKVIPEEDRLLTMRVQEEGYSRRGPSFDYEGTRRRLFQKRTVLTWIFSIITSFIHINSKCNVWSSWEYIYVKTGQETELSELILRNLAHCEWKKTN